MVGGSRVLSFNLAIAIAVRGTAACLSAESPRVVYLMVTHDISAARAFAHRVEVPRVRPSTRRARR
jgi:hypothetical protein